MEPERLVGVHAEHSYEQRRRRLAPAVERAHWVAHRPVLQCCDTSAPRIKIHHRTAEVGEGVQAVQKSKTQVSTSSRESVQALG